MLDIAEALGVSVGTVDRALHEKPGVSPMTRQRVLSMARTLGYSPNLAARYLSARKEMRLAVNLPRLSCLFFDDVWNGIVEAAESVRSPGVALVPRRYPNRWEAETEAFSAALHNQVQAIIVSPENTGKLKLLIRDAARRRIPVLCLTTDAPGRSG